MKKFLSLLLVLAMVLSLAACGNKETVEETPEVEIEQEVEENQPAVDEQPAETPEQPEEKPEVEQTPEVKPEEKPEVEQTPEVKPEEEQAPAVGAVAPLDVLTNAWAAMGDEEKFAAAGGDSSAMVMDGPGAFDIANTEELDALLGLNADGAAKIDAAASLMHRMNANTFTCGAYSLKSGEDADAFVSALRDNIQARQWMCGFPEKLVIVTVDNVVISMFGNGQIVDTFSAKLGGTVVVDEAIL